MGSVSQPGFGGGRIVAATAVIVAIEAGAILCSEGATERGLHLLLRSTAITSLVVFLAAYSASALRATWPGRAGDWLVDNRRYLGLSFAVSHGVHLAAIIALWRVTGVAPDALTLVVGGLGYVFLVAMAATSFDATAAWLGARRWRGLHSIGIQYLWLVFMLTLLGKFGRSPVATVAVLALFGALCLRVAVRLRRRAARQLEPA